MRRGGPQLDVLKASACSRRKAFPIFIMLLKSWWGWGKKGMFVDHPARERRGHVTFRP